MTTVDLSGVDKVKKFLRIIQGSAESRIVRTALGEDGSQLVRENFYEKDKTPNQLGGKRTHFYRQAGDATGYDLHPEGASIFTTKLGVRQRLEGGVITPKKAKGWLTIPLTPEAHGRRARDFPGLEAGGGYLSDDEGRAHYVFKKRVKQEEDPTVLPSKEALKNQGTVTVLSTVELLLQRS